jgi:hypothetical protein
MKHRRPLPSLREGRMHDAGDGRMADHKQSRRPRLEMGLGRARCSALGAWQFPCELIVGAASRHLATECLAEIDPMNPLLVAMAIVSGGIRRGLALTDKELLVGPWTSLHGYYGWKVLGMPFAPTFL